MSRRLKIFVGSSSETLYIAKEIQKELFQEAIFIVWEDSSVFRVGQFVNSELVRVTKEVDCAFFILGPDDTTESRGVLTPSPRDNVIYEAGLFGGVLGIERVIFLVDCNGTKIPSDWSGITYIPYDPKAENYMYDLKNKISITIRDFQSSFNNQITGSYWQLVLSISSDKGADDLKQDGSIISIVNIVQDDSNTYRLSGKSWDVNGKRKAIFNSSSLNYDPRSKIVNYSWSGGHPASNNRDYIGVGEISFKHTDGEISAFGFYTSHFKSENQIIGRQVMYIKMSEEDFSAIEESSIEKRKNVINKWLEKRIKYQEYYYTGE